MKKIIKLLMLIILIPASSHGANWKYYLIHENGKEEAFRLDSQKEVLIQLPKTKWTCAVDALTKSKDGEAQIEQRALLCSYEEGYSVSTNVTCSDKAPNNHKTTFLHLREKHKNDEVLHRVALQCINP